MKFKEIKPKKKTAEVLDEVRMSPAVYEKFLKSPAGQGMMAGFEAEMIFPDVVDDFLLYRAPEPDYDVDEHPGSVREIISFFRYDGNLSPREQDNLREELVNDFNEWVEEQATASFEENQDELVYDFIEKDQWHEDYDVEQVLLRRHSQEETQRIMSRSTESDRETYDEAFDQAKTEFKELVDDEIKNKGSMYKAALAEFIEKFKENQDIDDWIYDTYRNMQDVASAYNLEWPYYAEPESNAEESWEAAATKLAEDFESVFPAETASVTSTKNDYTEWHFKQDASIRPMDDTALALEIVSPVKPLAEIIDYWLLEFFAWTNTHDAETNSSCGFHMGVSLPSQRVDKVDTIKLALFLGDKYILEQFGREANTYCESFAKKISTIFSRVSANPNSQDVNNLAKLFEDLRSGLLGSINQIIHNSEIGGAGFGKYFSISPRGNYIEFRSAGGSDYEKDVPKLADTLMRYAYSMYLASEPTLEKEEYMKKLYKIIKPSIIRYWDPQTTDPTAARSGWLRNVTSKKDFENPPEGGLQYHNIRHVEPTRSKSASRIFIEPGKNTQAEFFDMLMGSLTMYIAGMLSAEQVKTTWAKQFFDLPQNQISRTKPATWSVIDRDNNEVMQLPNMRGQDALKKAVAELAGGSMKEFISKGYDIDIVTAAARKTFTKKAELASKFKLRSTEKQDGKLFVISLKDSPEKGRYTVRGSDPLIAFFRAREIFPNVFYGKQFSDAIVEEF